MQYPKPVMRKSELEQMGFPEEYLLRIYRTPKQRIAWKMDPLKNTSPIVFDTEELEKFRIAEIDMQVSAMPR